MSVFTNPAAGAAADARRYIDAVLALLGDADPWEVLRGTPRFLEERIGGLSAEVLRRPEAPGKWSAAQVVQHLADAEVAWAWRLRMALSHDRPSLTGYDQDLWADRLGYADADAEQALAEFTAFRRSNLRLLDRATPADLERVAVHVERGSESVAHMIRLNAGHDLVHRNQLVRVLRAVGGDPG